MKNQTTLLIAALIAAPFLCNAQSREDALKPHLDRVWNRWADLPSQYQDQHKATLQRYLDMFTTSNGFTWNQKWTGFARSMGQEFTPFYADVIEAMKVAEVYEAGFPNPEERLPKIAEAIFGCTPSNALLFVQNDVFETILLLQQQNGRRSDVLLVNSSRLMDPSYVKIILDRHPKGFRCKQTELYDRMVNVALRLQGQGYAEFQNLQVVDGTVRSAGPQLVTSLSFLMMQEMSQSASSRLVLFMPSLLKPEPVRALRDLHSAGMFFTWQKPTATKSTDDPIVQWKILLDAAAPVGEPVHGVMANAISRIVHAAAGIHDSQEMREQSASLLAMWDERVKSVSVVSGRDIVINLDGEMVQQSP